MNETNTAQVTAANEAPAAPTWGVGGEKGSYHRGFANVLKLSVALQAFVLPLLIWIVVGALIIGMTEKPGVGILAMIIGYAVTAFALWFSLSYKTKLFDNVSKLAQNSEQMLQLMKKKNGDR